MKIFRLCIFSISLFSSGIVFPDCYDEGNPSPFNESFFTDADDTTVLLYDQIDLERYIADFPFNEYSIFTIPTQGKFFVNNIDDYIKSHLRQGITWEPYMLDLLKQYISPGSTVLDIGAHIGTHTISMSKLTGPQGKVVAFEPQSRIFRELYWNCRLNRVNHNVEIHRLALGNAHGVVQMNESPKGNEGGTPIGKGGDPVEQRTVDSFHLTNVSLMKIDVEGFEDAVLIGARKMIEANHPVIIIELMGGYIYETAPDWVRKRVDRSKKILFEMGYIVKPIPNTYYDYIAHPGKKTSL